MEEGQPATSLQRARYPSSSTAASEPQNKRLKPEAGQNEIVDPKIKIMKKEKRKTVVTEIMGPPEPLPEPRAKLRVPWRMDFVAEPPELAADDIVSARGREGVAGKDVGVKGLGGKGMKEICAEGQKRKAEIKREEARRKIDAMANTVGFSANLEAMYEFEKMMGIKSDYWLSNK